MQATRDEAGGRPAAEFREAAEFFWRLAHDGDRALRHAEKFTGTAGITGYLETVDTALQGLARYESGELEELAEAGFEIDRAVCVSHMEHYRICVDNLRPHFARGSRHAGDFIEGITPIFRMFSRFLRAYASIIECERELRRQMKMEALRSVMGRSRRRERPSLGGAGRETGPAWPVSRRPA